MTKPLERGLFRLAFVLSILWIAGMGWYQYEQAQNDKSASVTIAFSKDSALRIDAGGISEEDKNAMRTKRFTLVFLPPLCFLLLVPVSCWLVRGFKPQNQKE